jgi:hypothetical protein
MRVRPPTAPAIEPFYLRSAKHTHRSTGVVVHLVGARDLAPTIMHAGCHRHCLRHQPAAQRILRWRHKPIHFIIGRKHLEFRLCFTTIPYFADTRSFICHTLAGMRTEQSRNSCHEEDSHGWTPIAIGPKQSPNASSTVGPIPPALAPLGLSGRRPACPLTPQPQPRPSMTCLRSRWGAMVPGPGFCRRRLWIYSPTLRFQFNPYNHTEQNACCDNICRGASRNGSQIPCSPCSRLYLKALRIRPERYLERAEQHRS